MGPTRDFGQLRYLDFGNGNGRRMVVVAADEDPNAALTADRLFYVFEGTSADGRYAVHVRYPVSVADFDTLAAAAGSPGALLLALDPLASSRFTPDLALLDALVASLQVVPEERFNYAAAAGRSAAPTASLCRPVETVIFSCRLDGDGRLVSVCASPDVSATTGYLAYYEGAAPEAIAFRYPELPAGSQEAFRYAEQTAPDRAFRSLSFAVGDTAYTLFDDYDATGEGTRRSAGVELLPPDGAAQQLLCGEPATHNLLALAPLVPAGAWRAVSDLATAPPADLVAAEPTVEPTATAAAPETVSHLVLAGETLAALGQRYGIDWPRIAAANNIPPPYRIQAGDVLLIPDADAAAAATPPAAGTATYVVRFGDTLNLIGQRTGIPWLEIAAANGIGPPYAIQAGQVLVLPAGAAPN
jgi:LysM repeat protein